MLKYEYLRLYIFVKTFGNVFFFQVFIDDSRDSLLKVGTTFLANESKVTLRFRFERKTFDWNLKSIEFDNGSSIVLLTSKQPIGAQKGLSYFSAGPVIFSNDTIVLKFNNKFQVSHLFLLIFLYTISQLFSIHFIVIPIFLYLCVILIVIVKMFYEQLCIVNIKLNLSIIYKSILKNQQFSNLYYTIKIPLLLIWYK